MRTTADYLALLTSAHRNRPDFRASVDASVDPFVGVRDVLFGLLQEFDLDSALGVQLDAVGRWIGLSRRVAIPLDAFFFSWDALPETGWDAGIWSGGGVGPSDVFDLPDDLYRAVLRAKIRANNWRGDIPGAYEIAISAFPALDGGNILIEDHQDMSMTVRIQEASIVPIEAAIITEGYLPLKPAGVKAIYILE